MLKKSTSGVLASLRGSTYHTGTPRPFASLRPGRTVFLSTLWIFHHHRTSRCADEAKAIPFIAGYAHGLTIPADCPTETSPVHH